MPRPAPDAICSGIDPRVKCAGRHDAGLRGEFLFDFHAKGWVWSAFKDDWRMVWDTCPWCKATLPNIAAVYARLRAGIVEDG